MTAQNLFEPDSALIIPPVFPWPQSQITVVPAIGLMTLPCACQHWWHWLVLFSDLIIKYIYNSGKGSSRFCDACKWQVSIKFSAILIKIKCRLVLRLPPFPLHHRANPSQRQLAASKKCRSGAVAVSSSNSLVKLIQCINCVQKGLKYQLIYES